MLRTLAVLSLLAIVMVACGDAATVVETDPTPTAEAPGQSPASSNGDQPDNGGGGAAKVGDKIKLGDEQYFTVKEVDRWPGSDFIRPDAGMKFVAVLTQIEGINPEGSSYNPFFFTLRDTDGFEYEFSAFSKEPQLQSSNRLQAGEKVQGWVTFEVPKSTKQVVLIYSPDFFGLDEPARVRFRAP
jgi:hypothetical protein